MALPPPSPESTCLLTGASSGIGADIARSLARRGYGTTLVARRTERLEELVEELRHQHGVRAETIASDLGDAAARDRLARQVDELGLTVVVPGILNQATALGGQYAPRGLFLRLGSRLTPVGR